MSQRESLPVEWGSLFNWTLMSMAGLVIGTAVLRFIFSITVGLLGGGLVGKAVEGAVIGLAIGLAQQFSLPPQITRGNEWAVASIIGWAIGRTGWRLGWSLLGIGGFAFNAALPAGIAGLVAGLLQWLILRRQVDQAGWWILANTAGWAIGLWVGHSSGGLLTLLISGAVAGLITGATLLWLIQQSQRRTIAKIQETAPNL